jgi:hypothetical protein
MSKRDVPDRERHESHRLSLSWFEALIVLSQLERRLKGYDGEPLDRSPTKPPATGESRQLQLVDYDPGHHLELIEGHHLERSQQLEVDAVRGCLASKALPHTRQAYLRDLKAFNAWTVDNGQSILTANLPWWRPGLAGKPLRAPPRPQALVVRIPAESKRNHGYDDETLIRTFELII